MKKQLRFHIREASSEDKEIIRQLVRYFWGEDIQVSFGMKFLVAELPAFVAVVDRHIAGFISYYDFNSEAILIVCAGVLPKYQGAGIGKALIKAVEDKARSLSKRKVLVSTTNDNLTALAFYQLLGFRIHEVASNVIAEKHGKVHIGLFGIPIYDEIRLYKDIETKHVAISELLG